MRHRAILFIAFILLSLGPLAGCAEVTQVGTTLGQSAGMLSKEDKEGLDRLAAQTAKAVRPMNDQEENYLGRAVAATLLSQYPLHPNDSLTAYVNEVGQAVALASDRPLTFGGYHFAVLDSDQVNALSCPGGMIFITRGMLQKIKSEDELAAVLAHEVAHVNHKDGVAAIQSSRWVEAASTLGSEAARKLGGAELAKLVSVFEGSVDDVVKTLLVKGYSREQEKAADQSALSFLHRLGYNPQALADYLTRLAGDQGTASKGAGIFATHPGMAERASEAKSSISQNRWTQKNVPERDRRFRQILGKG
jgi:predicted Zn-dependent protease